MYEFWLNMGITAALQILNSDEGRLVHKRKFFKLWKSIGAAFAMDPDFQELAETEKWTPTQLASGTANKVPATPKAAKKK